MDWCQSASEESKEGGHHAVEELQNHVHRPGYEASQLNLPVSQSAVLRLFAAIFYSFTWVVRADEC
jgi:hypothetical protein